MSAGPVSHGTRHEQALLGFASIALVMAYRYQPLFLFFPVQAFHLGLIFFAFGHLALLPVTGTSLAGRIADEARSWLGLCCLASFFFALVTVVLAHAGLSPGGTIPTLSLGSLRDVLLAPLGFAEPLALFQPAWILVAVFLAAAAFHLLASLQSRIALWAALAASGGIALALLDAAPAAGFALLAGRTAFALAFYLGGFLLKTASDRARRALLSPAALVVFFLVADALGAASGGLAYRLEQGSLGSRGAISLLGTADLCLLVYSLAHQAARIVGGRSALLALGRSFRPVLAWMSAAFFATNLALLALGFIGPEQIPAALSFHLNQTWLFYLVPALALPALGHWLWTRATQRPEAA